MGIFDKLFGGAKSITLREIQIETLIKNQEPDSVSAIMMSLPVLGKDHPLLTKPLVDWESDMRIIPINVGIPTSSPEEIHRKILEFVDLSKKRAGTDFQITLKAFAQEELDIHALATAYDGSTAYYYFTVSRVEQNQWIYYKVSRR